MKRGRERKEERIQITYCSSFNTKKILLLLWRWIRRLQSSFLLPKCACGIARLRNRYLWGYGSPQQRRHYPDDTQFGQLQESGLDISHRWYILRRRLSCQHLRVCLGPGTSKKTTKCHSHKTNILVVQEKRASHFLCGLHGLPWQPWIQLQPRCLHELFCKLYCIQLSLQVPFPFSLPFPVPFLFLFVACSLCCCELIYHLLWDLVNICFYSFSQNAWCRKWLQYKYVVQLRLQLGPFHIPQHRDRLP